MFVGTSTDNFIRRFQKGKVSVISHMLVVQKPKTLPLSTPQRAANKSMGDPHTRRYFLAASLFQKSHKVPIEELHT
jgi:hypothetical protein